MESAPDQAVVQEVSSFQQKVARARLDGEDVYVKHIVSDYSWWTFDTSDIYRREVMSHAIMSQITGVEVLRSADPAKRQFVMRALPNLNLQTDTVEGFVEMIIPLLRSLREVSITGLEKLGFLEIAEFYREKSARAKVESHLTEEITTYLHQWHATFGSALCFAHGDLHDGNILIAEGGTLYPFDYEESIEGPPYFDAATVGWHIQYLCGDASHAFYKEAYQRAFHEPLIDLEQWTRFCRLRGWLACCYLTRCCDTPTIQAAASFIRDPLT